MDDITGLQVKAGGDHRRAGVTVADLVAGGLQTGMARCPENRAADPAARPEAFVGGVDDGVRLQRRDVGFLNADCAHKCSS